jgi:hypothetical protein
VWTVTAVVVFVLSLAGPAGGASAGAVLALSGLHLVVALVLIAGLPRTGRPAGRAARVGESRP